MVELFILVCLNNSPMLLHFSIQNFLSFYEKQHFSLETEKISSKSKELDQNNIIPASLTSPSLLKTALIYGSNSSGKSNFIRALACMQHIVLRSDKQTPAQCKWIPFLLKPDAHNSTGSFEMVFLLKEIPYFYGFEVNKENIVKEWLSYRPKKKKLKLFTRTSTHVDWSKKHFEEGSKIPTSIPDHTLLVTLLSKQKEGHTGAIYHFFDKLLLINNQFSYHNKEVTNFTQKLFFKDKYNNYPQKILRFLQSADISIESLMLTKMEQEKLKIIYAKEDVNPEQINLESIVHDPKKETPILLTRHTLQETTCEDTDDIYFNLATQESEGTRKLIAYSGLIIKVLARGGILIIDQLDAHLHPLVTRKILEIFHHPQTNPANAQLIFTSHDVSLLNRKLLRRDQIWFMSKNKHKASQMQALSALKGVRNDASYGKDYIKGKYGAIPKLGDFDLLDD